MNHVVCYSLRLFARLEVKENSICGPSFYFLLETVTIESTWSQYCCLSYALLAE